MSPLPILTHLPCLLLQVPDLLSNDCQLAAGVCSDKVISLREKMRAGQDGKNCSLWTVLGQLWLSSRHQQSCGVQELPWNPRAGARTRSCLDRLRGSDREQQDILGGNGLDWEAVGCTGTRQ